ncbi:MAG: E3 ubiquitin ligase family protein [Candidatus Omnitrophica bacterium]|nr:E3 ubiquitin ligase family protein [Candidatus Omnitrophota bacterium]
MRTDIETRIFIWSIIGFFIGIYFFFTGFRKLWAKRLIQNIPTSKIRSIAMGLVEINGIAIPDVLLTGPYTKVPCVFYHILVERLVRTQKSAHWVKELEIKTDIPFFVKDDTGVVMIDPSGAETDLPLRYTNIENGRRYREWNIMEKEPIYVLGTAKRLEGIEEKIQKEVEARIKEIIENPDEKIKLDINKDMWIDEEEWMAARERIKEQVRKEFEGVENNLRNSSHNIPGHLQDIVIGKGELDRHFIISNKSEKELVTGYKYKIFFSIFGGIALSLVCLKILLYCVFEIIIK